MKLFMGKKIVIFLIFLAITLFYTKGIFGNFFQQDEWAAFGSVIYLNKQPFWEWFGAFAAPHYVPLGLILWSFMYKLFGFQAQYYVLASLALHTTASFLVYILVYKLSKEKWVSFLTALFFATNSRASMAFIHLAIFPTTITSYIFILLFLIYLASILKEKYFRGKDFFILILLFFSSVLFREDGMILIPLFPIFLLLFNREKYNRKNLKFFLLFIGTALLFLLFRFSLYLTNPTTKGMISEGISKTTYALVCFYNLWTLPIKFIVQNLLDGGSLFSLMLKNSQYLYPDKNIPFLDSYPVFMDLTFLVIFDLLLVMIVFLGMSFTSKKEFRRYSYFGIAWILANTFLLSSVGRPLYLLESRYLYLASLPVFLILSFILIGLYKSKSMNIVTLIVKKLSVLIILASLTITSYFSIQETVREKSFYGTARKQILSDILTLYPTIPKETIFYVECKKGCERNGEFAVPSRFVLPFTSGSGWIILLYYAQKNEKAYSDFFQSQDFLWGEGAQGYKKIGDYGFGYFYEKELLKKTLQDAHLDKKIVIGLEYNEDDFNIKDISSAVQNEL